MASLADIEQLLQAIQDRGDASLRDAQTRADANLRDAQTRADTNLREAMEESRTNFRTAIDEAMARVDANARDTVVNLREHAETLADHASTALDQLKNSLDQSHTCLEELRLGLDQTNNCMEELQREIVTSNEGMEAFKTEVRDSMQQAEDRINATVQQRFAEAEARVVTVENRMTASGRELQTHVTRAKEIVDDQIKRNEDANKLQRERLTVLEEKVLSAVDQANVTLECCAEYQEKIEEVENKVSDRLNAKITGLQSMMDRSHAGLAETLRGEIRDVSHQIGQKADKKYVENRIDGLRGELDGFAREIVDPAGRERIATRLEFTPPTTRETDELRERMDHFQSELERVASTTSPEARVIHTVRTGELGKLPTFSNASHESPVNYIESLEEYFRLNEMSNERKLALLESSIKANPSYWYKVYKRRIRTFAEFKKLFLSKFWSPDVQALVNMDIRTGSYNKYGQIDRATYFLQRVAQNFELSNPISEEEFVNVMTRHFSHEVQNIVLARGVTSIDGLESILRSLDTRISKSNKTEDASKGDKSKQDVRFSEGGKKTTPKPVMYHNEPRNRWRDERNDYGNNYHQGGQWREERFHRPPQGKNKNYGGGKPPWNWQNLRRDGPWNNYNEQQWSRGPPQGHNQPNQGPKNQFQQQQGGKFTPNPNQNKQVMTTMQETANDNAQASFLRVSVPAKVPERNQTTKKEEKKTAKEEKKKNQPQHQ